MPKYTNIDSVLIIGAGPIIIGQACEFDYSGVQACKALKEEGIRIILINSNPATIMTDPGLSDATYIEPIRWESIEKIIEHERPDAILPTMGGQTALNCALDLFHKGILEKYNVKIIGADVESIAKAEDRNLFEACIKKIGLNTPRSGFAHTIEEANYVIKDIGFPCIIRPSFTMGGTGGGIAYNREEFEEISKNGLMLSPTSELLIDESLIGWKEFELEVVRDRHDNAIIICSIENLDPMGVHTGDSITVAPAQTLTDKEFQIMRNASLAILREIGVETGGSNVQFGINPKDGRMVVIEMNPRVSRSSALASKATGFPIARVAAKLAIGYTLDELKNDITNGKTPASFEPTIDYVVTKIPRFTFEKFPQADDRLTTQMKSVGEVMGMGRNFQESLQKAIRSIETGTKGFDLKLQIKDNNLKGATENTIKNLLATPKAERLWYIAEALRFGMSVESIFELTNVDTWFIVQIADLINEEQLLSGKHLKSIDKDTLFRLKRKGFGDARLAALLYTTEKKVRDYREELNIKPVFKRVDSCAAEFDSTTAYLYSSYDEECEANISNRKKIIVLGGGPNRIGQGIEFDYCCVHAILAMKSEGYETIMINCNPETVSTDYDISDRLYFEPVTLENVLSITDLEKPTGVIVQYGGQTPLKLAKDLANEGVPIIGTQPKAIDRAEDRELFKQMIDFLKFKQPANKTVKSTEEALENANTIGYPIMVRPSYVLGGRAMEIVHNSEELQKYMSETVHVSQNNPILLDNYLSHAIEIDIDAICDGHQVVICAIMQHIEQAGIHSGDSACSLPPYNLSASVLDTIRDQIKELALELEVIGLLNVQIAVKDDDIYFIEVNPRASRTVPFVSKCVGAPLASIAAKVMAGRTLKELNFTKEIKPKYWFVKEAVFPFNKFSGTDPILGPEMKSTGEVMGIGESFAEAYAKAQLAIKMQLPTGGKVIISVQDYDKPFAADLSKLLIASGFTILATRGTAKIIEEAGIPVEIVNKVKEGRPHMVDMIVNGEISLVVNTATKRSAINDSYTIRRSALIYKVLYSTTMIGANSVAQAILFGEEKQVRKLQNLYAGRW